MVTGQSVRMSVSSECIQASLVKMEATGYRFAGAVASESEFGVLSVSLVLWVELLCRLCWFWLVHLLLGVTFKRCQRPVPKTFVFEYVVKLRCLRSV